MRRIVWVLSLGAVACRQAVPPDPPPSPANLGDQAAAGVEDPRLGALLIDHWEWVLRQEPVFATSLGDHRYDDQLADRSPAGLAAAQQAMVALRDRARAIPFGELSRPDQVTLGLFIEELEASLGREVCRFEQWNLSPRGNPFADHAELVELHPVKTEADGQKLLARYRLVPREVEAALAHLQLGVAAGLYGNAESVRRTLAMLDGELQKPVSEWAYATPVQKSHGWSPEAEAKFKAELLQILEVELKPAFTRYRNFVAEQISPKARPADKSGVGVLPIGAECYRATVRIYTNLSRSPEELHRLGLQEIERINGEMRILGKKLFGTDDLAAIVSKLRSDPSLRFQNAAELEVAAESALIAAKAAIPQAFGVLPKADCVIARIPDHEAPFTSIAYYRQPIPDGSKPGEFFVNTYQAETRPRFEMEALAFHESIPGHHLQIAIAQELPAIPAFRKHLGTTAFVEGWALYTERLADELGLYTSDLSRMGMLSFDAWRASRLVVDTGLHALGWSRSQAQAFMRDHTALAENNIDNEVDRYLVWPGQALAYKTGQLEIWRLRREAERSLGKNFDLRGFHDAVLTGGAVTMSVLAQQVEDWVQSRN
ncbi:MAG: DUF885 domain-containing protein [Deltaproteobacteria bacterium]|nr:DUF885 domain-containing protein [Deltaproteobacteria bacterium]